VERPARAVTVSSLTLLRDPKDPQTVQFRVACSKGTYIRSLVFDLVHYLPSSRWSANIHCTGPSYLAHAPRNLVAQIKGGLGGRKSFTVLGAKPTSCMMWQKMALESVDNEEHISRGRGTGPQSN